MLEIPFRWTESMWIVIFQQDFSCNKIFHETERWCFAMNSTTLCLFICFLRPVLSESLVWTPYISLWNNFQHCIWNKMEHKILPIFHPPRASIFTFFATMPYSNARRTTHGQNDTLQKNRHFFFGGGARSNRPNTFTSNRMLYFRPITIFRTDLFIHHRSHFLELVALDDAVKPNHNHIDNNIITRYTLKNIIDQTTTTTNQNITYFWRKPSDNKMIDINLQINIINHMPFLVCNPAKTIANTTKP